MVKETKHRLQVYITHGQWLYLTECGIRESRSRAWLIRALIQNDMLRRAAILEQLEGVDGDTDQGKT